MTRDEIVKIGTIIAYADGGCVNCVALLIYEGITLNKRFDYTLNEVKERIDK